MTTNNTPPPDQNRQQPRENRQPHWIIQVLIQIVVIRITYSLYTSTKKTISPKTAEILKLYKNYFDKGELFDLYGVVSTDIRIDFQNIGHNAILAYINENQEYEHTFNRPFERKRVRIVTTDEFHDDLNKNLYFTVFLIPHKSYLRKEREFYRSTFKEGIDGHYLVKTIPLTKKMKAEPSSEGVNLMSDSPSSEKARAAKDAGKAPRVYEKYFVPRVDINLVFDLKQYSPASNDVYFESFTKHHAEHLYDPYLYLSQFWVLQDQMVKVTNFGEDEDFRGPGARPAAREDAEPEPVHKNSEHMQVGERFELWSDGTGELAPEHEDSYLESVVELRNTELQKVGERRDALGDWNMLELEINYSTCLGLYYMVLHNMSQKPTHNLLGIDNTKEIDVLKKTLMTTNVYFLAFSALFILLHTVFSVFALKNDIQFWHNNKSMEGLSTITLVINLVCEVGAAHAQIIIGLYVYDSEESSALILFEILLNVLSSAWKLTKAVKVRVKREYPYVYVEAQEVSAANAQTRIESETKKYDAVAIKYMSMLMAPLVGRAHAQVVGYAVYSLYKNKYKSWYSYVISVLAGSVYTFGGRRSRAGFIMMTPQLYINYKLKSVEHLPWRALIYRYATQHRRSLNTFVDDVASFLIDMPMLHRLSCFRDDIIFFCYLYQRWKYRVDPNRRVGGSAESAEGTQELTQLEDREGGEEEPRLRPNAAAREAAAAEAEGQTQPE